MPLMRWIALPMLLLAFGLQVATAAGSPPDTRVIETSYGFSELVQRLQQAIADNGMGLVTQASASRGAAARGLKIPGNMVLGVYRNDFAVRMLEASVEAGIEAPIRFYVTEESNGKAALRYRTPSAVFAPYDSDELDRLAAELDGIFQRIAQQATR